MRTLLLALFMVSLLNAKQTLDLTQYSAEKWSEPVIVSVGDTLEINLRENPSTGFRWLVLD